jgi:hypothetical protein
MTEYFTEIDKIPHRDYIKLYGEVIQKFLDSKLNLVKVNPEVFESKSQKHLGNNFRGYVKIRQIPVKVHCIQGIVYLERI